MPREHFRRFLEFPAETMQNNPVELEYFRGISREVSIFFSKITTLRCFTHVGARVHLLSKINVILTNNNNRSNWFLHYTTTNVHTSVLPVRNLSLVVLTSKRVLKTPTREERGAAGYGKSRMDRKQNI